MTVRTLPVRRRPSDDGRAPTELAAYVALVRRRWRALLGCVVLGVVAAAAYGALSPSTNTLTTDVLLRPVPMGDSTRTVVSPPQVNVDAEAQGLVSDAVLTRARAALGTNASNRDLASRLQVYVPPATTVLRISFSAPSAARAQAGAAAIAQAYLAERQARAQAVVTARIGALRARVDALQTQLQRVAAQQVALPRNSPLRTYAQAQLRVLLNELTPAQDQLTAVATRNVLPGAVVRQATRPPRPAAPVHKVLAAEGAMLGLLAGLVVAVVRDRHDQRVHSPAELGVPVLARMPASRPHLLAVGRGADDAALRRLAAALVAPLRGIGGRGVIVVADVTGSDVGASLATGVGMALARRGTRTLLLSTASSSTPAALLGAHHERGLADVLAGRAPFDAVVQQAAQLPALRVLAAGPGADADADADAVGPRHPRLLDALEAAREHADVVVVHAPVALGSSIDPAVVAQADVAVIAATLGVTSRAGISAAGLLFARAGVRVLGAVVANRGSRLRSAPRTVAA